MEKHFSLHVNFTTNYKETANNKNVKLNTEIVFSCKRYFRNMFCLVYKNIFYCVNYSKLSSFWQMHLHFSRSFHAKYSKNICFISSCIPWTEPMTLLLLVQGFFLFELQKCCIVVLFVHLCNRIDAINFLRWGVLLLLKEISLLLHVFKCRICWAFLL